VKILKGEKNIGFILEIMKETKFRNKILLFHKYWCVVQVKVEYFIKKK